MKASDYKMISIEPNDGFVLTQSGNVDIKSRTFSTLIYMSGNSDPNEWKEIPIEEAEIMRKEQELAFREDELKRELESLKS